MPFIKIVKPPCACMLPSSKDKSIYFGSEWQCEVCGKIYRLEEDQREGRYWAMQLPQSQNGGAA